MAHQREVPISRRRMNPNEEQHHLVQALLDQYNDDNGFFGVFPLSPPPSQFRLCFFWFQMQYFLFQNRAHVLESLLRHEWIHEKNKTGNLFFAEVSQKQGERAWKVKCCCIIDSNENGIMYPPPPHLKYTCTCVAVSCSIEFLFQVLFSG